MNKKLQKILQKSTRENNAFLDELYKAIYKNENFDGIDIIKRMDMVMKKIAEDLKLS